MEVGKKTTLGRGRWVGREGYKGVSRGGKGVEGVAAKGRRARGGVAANLIIY